MNRDRPSTPESGIFSRFIFQLFSQADLHSSDGSHDESHEFGLPVCTSLCEYVLEMSPDCVDTQFVPRRDLGE